MMVSDKNLLEIHRWMIMERLMDEKINELFRMGKIMSMFHSALGHEAAYVGAAYALRDGDVMIPNHRGKVIYLMRGMDLNYFMAGLFGRKEGFGQGRVPVGSHMCGDQAIGLVPAQGIVGSAFVVGIGAALALKLQKKPQAALIFIGDGGSNRGDVHEGMNFASVLKLPAVFLFINNGWSLSVRSSYGLSVEHISVRAAGYNIPGVTIDGRDVLRIYETVNGALERARQGGGPTLIEAMVDRWSAHSINDPDVYRTDEDRARARQRDPLKEYEGLLRERGFFDHGEDQKIREDLKAIIEAAVRYADQCSEPGMVDLMFGVYEPKG